MKNIKFNFKLVSITCITLLFISSCSLIDGIWWMMCDLAPESDHCFQFIAVQSSSPETCEKIKWTSFKDGWSNPPKDKCYMQIAINSWDESICNSIKWWLMSYTKEECQWETRTKVVKTIDEELQELNSKIEYSVDFKDTEALLKQKKELQAKLKESFDKLPETEKTAYYVKKKDEILKWVTDNDLKQQIAHSFAKQRKWFNWDTLSELEWLKKITETETIAKSLDENANMLVDSVKNTLVDIANEKKDAILDEAKEKLLEEAYKRSWADMKNALSKLEWLKDTYDKWSEYYNSVNEKYEKLKAAYDKMKDIQDRLNKIEQLWKEWKLDSGKVEVLKWSILLWEWLEYATWYVPVFWSTISTVTKETFWVVNKFATDRAIRTTSIDKCINDPLNCDVDWISGY
jgi:hypothetical protein